MLRDQSGAVTVDWVVLTAGLVGLGLATMSFVSTGVQDTSTDTAEQLSSTPIFTSFGQREFSEYYDATLAIAEIDPTNITSGSWADFQGQIETIQNAEDGEILAHLQNGFTQLAHENSSRLLAEIGDLDPATTSAAEYAAAYNAAQGTNFDAVTVQGWADNDSLSAGDLATYIQSRQAIITLEIEHYEAYQQEADSRGLSY